MAAVSSRSLMMVEHPRPNDVYRELLELLYGEVRTTTSVLRSVHERACELATQGDPVSLGMLPWLQEHIREETGHDRWLLSDYQAIGGDRSALVAKAGDPAFAAMVGSVYYWSLFAHPVAVLGYCAVLEGTPPAEGFVAALIDATGLPPDAFGTLRHHSTLDVDHGAEVYELIDALPLEPRHESIIGMTALQTADLLVAAANDLLDRVGAAI
jgi:hypothetical protein